jgi:hypothetical protein
MTSHEHSLDNLPTTTVNPNPYSKGAIIGIIATAVVLMIVFTSGALWMSFTIRRNHHNQHDDDTTGLRTIRPKPTTLSMFPRPPGLDPQVANAWQQQQITNDGTTKAVGV